MKIAALCTLIGFPLTVCACAEDAPSLAAVEEAGKNYLKKIDIAQEVIDKAQEDYLKEIRLVLLKTKVIEVFLLDPRAMDYLDVFEAGGAEFVSKFVELYADRAFKIVESARIEKAKEVSAFLEAAVPQKSWNMLMFSYYPHIGFRCLDGESELFVATLDPYSSSLRVVFPDGKWTRMGIDVDSTRSILKSVGIKNVPEPPKP